MVVSPIVSLPLWYYLSLCVIVKRTMHQEEVETMKNLASRRLLKERQEETAGSSRRRHRIAFGVCDFFFPRVGSKTTLFGVCIIA